MEAIAFWEEIVKSKPYCMLAPVRARVTIHNPWDAPGFGGAALNEWVAAGPDQLAGSIIFKSCGGTTGNPTPQELGRFNVWEATSKKRIACEPGAEVEEIILTFATIQPG